MPDDATTERPACPRCGRALGPAPGYAGFTWKCRVHGSFHPDRFDADALAAMRADADPSLLSSLGLLVMALPLLLWLWVKQRIA